MEHTEALTRYFANFVDELARSGIKAAVISPGSRSTPLAMTLTEHSGINQWVVIDERSAAFFALGMAKKNKRPVAIVCSSGTATANYFPAIIEAHYSRVPLVVLTADRPHELRDVGAPQAIDQIKLYGDHVKWFNEMALPEGDEKMLNYVRSKASRAVHLSQAGNAGPVHLNFPIREPFIPDFSLKNLWGEERHEKFYFAFDGKQKLKSEQLNQLIEKLKNKEKGLIVCGPQTNDDFPAKVTELATAWNLPIIADPLSGLRSGDHRKDNIIEGYDAFLRNEMIRSRLDPDFIIRFGAMPVSKPYLFYVTEHEESDQFVVENSAGYREPAGNATQFIYADDEMLCEDLIKVGGNLSFDQAWLAEWQRMNAVAKKHLLALGDDDVLTEGDAVRTLVDVIPNENSLYVGNSMAIRDVDTFFMTTDKKLSILANRGANGIDGMVSSGVGASALGDHVTLLLGDLSFFHDMNGLLAAKHYQLNMTILLINNNGGGIFSFLPQANHKEHFEALFGTPLNLEFKQAIEMYGGSYCHARNKHELQQALRNSYQHKGLSVVEVKTNRDENLKWHRDKWKKIEDELLGGE